MHMRIALVGAIAAIMFGAVACTGDGSDPLALDEYLSEVERLDDAAEQEQGQLEAAFDESAGEAPESGPLSQQFKDALTTYYEELVRVGGDYINDIDDLEPPDVAQSAHEEYIEAYDEVLVALNDIVDDIDGVSTTTDLTALLDNQALTSAYDRANEACAGLQQVATDNNVDVDFECQTS